MSPIGLGLDLILIGLLLAALIFGMRLNRRLKALRDTQAGFAQAALNLDAAIARAEQGMAELRIAARDSEETLTERVDEARAAARKLDEALARAKAAPRPSEPELVLGAREAETARLSVLRAATPAPSLARQATPEPVRTPFIPREVESFDRAPAAPVAADLNPRSRARVDDDLFADAPGPRARGGGR